MSDPASRSTEPPEFSRKLRLYPYQWVGFAILFLIPLLALFGVFGETRTEVQASAEGIELKVEYTNRTYFEAINNAQITIHNRSDAPISTLTIAIDKAFLDNYQDISFTPNVHEITADAYIIVLNDLQTGATEIVTLESRSHIAGYHVGRISATTPDSTVSVPLETIIFP